MRSKILRKEQVEKTEKIICNKCGKEIIVSGDIVKEGVFSIDYTWGYFSEKDGQCHTFDLCEHCYDEMLGSFVVPAEVLMQ